MPAVVARSCATCRLSCLCEQASLDHSNNYDLTHTHPSSHLPQDACTALANAWVSHAASLTARDKLDADGLVDLGVKAVVMLEAASKAAAAAEAAPPVKGAPPVEPVLGACLTGEGEGAGCLSLLPAQLPAAVQPAIR